MRRLWQWLHQLVDPPAVLPGPNAAEREAGRLRVEAWHRTLRESAAVGRPARDWRQVTWSEVPSGSLRDRVAYVAHVGERALLVEPVRGGGYHFAVTERGGTQVWSEHTLGLEAAQFLAVAHADPAYLDWAEAAAVLGRFMTDCMDPDYLNQVNIETFGWDGFIADAVETGGLEGVVTELTLLDGTRLTRMDGRWRV